MPGEEPNGRSLARPPRHGKTAPSCPTCGSAALRGPCLHPSAARAPQRRTAPCKLQITMAAGASRHSRVLRGLVAGRLSHQPLLISEGHLGRRAATKPFLVRLRQQHPRPCRGMHSPAATRAAPGHPCQQGTPRWLPQAHNGGGGAVAAVVLNDFNLAVLPHAHTAAQQWFDSRQRSGC